MRGPKNGAASAFIGNLMSAGNRLNTN